jgi:hypothetical protein
VTGKDPCQEVNTMATTMTREYKGYRIELTPTGDYCAAFAVDVRDGEGRLVSHLGVGGNTEARAVERGRELIDFERDLGTLQ